MSDPLASVNLNLLVSLDALLEESSVTRAALICGVTQGAMSQSLAQLRQVFGDDLLVRGRGGMTPTPRAERLRPEVRRALAEVRRVFDETPEFDPAASRRRFRIGAEDAAATLLLTKLIPRIEHEAPGVDLDFLAFRGEADTARLETGELDFALDVGLPETSSIRAADAFPDDLVAVTRRGHPAVGDAGLDLDTYCSLSHLVVGTAAPHVLSVVDRALAKVDRSRRVGLRLKYFNAAAPVVAVSDLVWNGPRRLAEYFASMLPLSVHEIPVPLEGYMVKVYWHARFEREPAHAWLRQRVIECSRA